MLSTSNKATLSSRPVPVSGWLPAADGIVDEVEDSLEITFRFVSDLSTRIAAVEKGEMQAAMAVEATDLARLKANPRITAYATATPGTVGRCPALRPTPGPADRPGDVPRPTSGLNGVSHQSTAPLPP
jgi:hypothetical protein